MSVAFWNPPRWKFRRTWGLWIMCISCTAGCVGGRAPLPSVANGGAIADAHSGRYRTFYAFKGGEDGQAPVGTMAVLNGQLYGETFYGGGCQHQRTCGTVFTIDSSGIEHVVYQFQGPRRNDGANPIGGLISERGSLFGVTQAGGLSNGGTVFQITPTGSEKVLHQFSRGQRPEAGLVFYDGSLYGTTFLGGGRCHCGSVFRVTLSGRKSTIHAFSNHDGANPSAPLVVSNGRLMGTTHSGGTQGLGVIFEVTPKSKFRVLHDFAGRPYDGSGPGGLLNYNGTIYGATASGGAQDLGSLFAFNARSKRPEAILHSFSGTPDGAGPQQAPTAVGDHLFGVTFAGGSSDCGASGCGTIYELLSSGKERVIHVFPASRKDGYYPYGGLTLFNGALYGVTESGGTHGFGTVFKITP